MITDKQYRVIIMIENNVGVKFKGSTKEEAKGFISQYIEKSKLASLEFRRNMLDIRLNEMENESESMDSYFSFGWYNMPH